MKINYRIFDVDKPILSDYFEIEAKNASEAVKKYLISVNEIDKKIKSSGSSFVRISAQPFYFKDGVRYKVNNKRTVWFEVN
jgi:hypothetical protein